tara:strand:+ start:21679 stop:23844 length:2166 start_codon:yes stop_codon:yes gene_type:complete
MKSIKKLILLITIATISFQSAIAKEGMWLPMLLKSLNETDMKGMGLQLSAEDIYSINQSSLKDAVISFGGFCTGEIISDQGLILTNHHCGYGRIQSHSSVENDYLTDGYWASNLKEELKNPGLTATFIVRMEDVTSSVLEAIDEKLSTKERNALIAKRIDSIVKAVTADTHYDAYIRPFFYGNEYYLFITETFKDVRLVGAPPSSIGKFGGDTDNWMWPRHTGDFSIFRIYADSNNMPAEYSESNVPYRPKHHFPISLEGVKEKDFTMVFGFPGRTQEYLTSYAIKQIKEVINPEQIAIREEALDILNRNMSRSVEVRIKYASKYASISNYWKKWIGENKGLQQTNAIGKKQDLEQAFEMSTKKVEEYNGLLDAFKVNYEAIEKYALARSYFIEIPYRKIEILSLANSFNSIVTAVNDDKEIEEEDYVKLQERINSFFKDFDLTTDREMAESLLLIYKENMPEEFTPEYLKSVSKEELNKKVQTLYSKSIFSDKAKLEALLQSKNTKKIAKLKQDPAFELNSQFWSTFRERISPEYNRISDKIDSLSTIYMSALRTYVPDRYYPDANSTLRLSYGKVEGFQPADAVTYDFFTTGKGILEKYDSSNVDFRLPMKLMELIGDEEFGPYRDSKGYLPVCFIASNHTSGGNSGSPVINAKGELIGLNFDRNWEGTMSDINYDISLCRNISVDIRYVLFVVDKFANAQHIMKELTLVKSKENKDEN